ncbi:MAG: crtE [Acidimicrobiia bacterium]|nr:crtE [Acidimicrobiia bacterium]
MSDGPASLVEIAERVERRLEIFLDGEQERWCSVDAVLGDAFEALRSLVMGGGKRLRPAFCHWGFVGAGGSPDDQRVIDAGAAFELLHAFALFHDDVMDGSATRRGRRTAHLEFEARHVSAQWVGEARRFGEGVAILIGDMAFVYADHLVRAAPLEALRIWDELRVELNVGQYLDIVGTARRERARAGAERIARYKSGKYTVERPLHLGAMLAAPEREVPLLEALSAYGLPVGDAFQLRDDVLGVFGDQQLTGKPVGDDLREGKPTPLLSIATERATTAQRQLLAGVGAADLSDEQVALMQSVIVDTGALAAMEAEIERLTGEAIAALGHIDIAPAAKDELTDLAMYMAQRVK